jgi:hypothetical protein
MIGMPIRNMDSSMSAIEGLQRKCTGKIGSLGVLYVIHVSNAPNRTRSTIPAVRVPIIIPLPHACDTPASCNANIRGIGQETESIPPMLSRLRMRSRLVLPSFRGGSETKSKPIATDAIGPLHCQLKGMSDVKYVLT